MVYFVIGAAVYGIFDFIELQRKVDTRERIIYLLLTAAAVAFGIWFFSQFERPDLSGFLIDKFFA